jgi:hypothetical protein
MLISSSLLYLSDFVSSGFETDYKLSGSDSGSSDIYTASLSLIMIIFA